ncbi:endothelin-converting enzyme 1-like [Amblyomma americanum]
MGKDSTVKTPLSLQKSEVPNKTCVLVCVVAFVSGTLLLVLALYKVPEILKNSACETPACVEISIKIRESLNASVEPCQDFAQFVCGGWGKTHNLSVAEEALVAALHSMGNRLGNIKVLAAGKQDMKLKAHLLYRSCHSVLKGERDELDNVRKALLEVGVVWPHTSPEPNVLSTLLRSSLALQWGAPYDVTLQQGSTGELVVELEPFRMFDRIRDKFRTVSGDGKEREAYFETLKSSFKQSDTNIVDFKTMNSLDKDAFSSFPPQVDSFPDPVTLDSKLAFEGIEYVTPALWREALSPYTPMRSPSNIFVMTHSEAFLRKFRELWRKNGRQKTHIFVSWLIVQIAALYANQKLLLNFYQSENRAVLVQGSSCLARAFLIARSEVFAGYGDQLLASKSRFLAYRLMLAVRQAFERSLRGWKGFDANVTIFRKHSGAEGVLHVLHAGFVPARNDTAADMQDSLVQNWRNAPIPAMEPELVRDMHSSIEAGKLLLLQEDDFALMPYAFAMPYFDEGFTAALNYAGVGGIASFAIAKLFFNAYSEPSGVNSSLQDALDCMSNFSADAQDESVAKQLTLRVLAAQTSFSAYQRHISSQDIPITGLESFSPQQLFFIASCYRLCAGGVQSAARAQCNEYLQHVDKFSRAFSCAESSPMNPPTKCGLL